MSRRQTPEDKRARWQKRREGRVTTEDRLKALSDKYQTMAQDYGGFVLAVRPHLPPEMLALADRILVSGFGVDPETLPDVTEPEPEQPSGLVVVGG